MEAWWASWVSDFSMKLSKKENTILCGHSIEYRNLGYPYYSYLESRAFRAVQRTFILMLDCTLSTLWNGQCCHTITIFSRQQRHLYRKYY